MEFYGLPPKIVELHAVLKKFVLEECIPAEEVFEKQLGEGKTRWTTIPPVMEELKKRARSLGLWNLFLPKNYPEGAGLSNLEYAPLCELMGMSFLAPEACNCNAPDTGNMEVLAKYGTPAQKEKWLKPLLEGTIRSAFAMTEPAVASSDATNIETSIRRDGNEYVINGRKWWTSGAGDPRLGLYILMGKTDTKASVHHQQSMIIVPANAKGVTIVRPLRVFGFDEAPHGHMEVLFEDVRVPAENMILGEGRGFEIAQGRLGPGRIHHCMRAIGCAERALDLMVRRVLKRKAFGKLIAQQGTIQKDIADSRIEIDQARLLVFKAAHMIDVVGAKGAKSEIAMIKVAIPIMLQHVMDRVIQAHGAAGVSPDYGPIAFMYAVGRTLRIADGPDEVHRVTIAKNELSKVSKL